MAPAAHNTRLTMSLLDELKAKADERRSDAELEAARLADQTAYYQSQLLPCMLQAYTFLQELTAHLKIVDDRCDVAYPLLPEDATITLQQGDYSVAIDSRQEPTQLELRCKAHLPEPVTFDVKGPAEVQRHKQLMDRYGLKYERTERKDDRFDIDSATFKLIGPIPVRVVIVADSENRCLGLHFRNVEQAGVKTVNITPDKFNDEFLDRLGRYILRQQANLFSTELSDEARQKLQEKLAKQREEDERARRVMEAERAALAKAEYESRPSVRLSRAMQSAADKLKAKLNKD